MIFYKWTGLLGVLVLITACSDDAKKVVTRPDSQPVPPATVEPAVPQYAPPAGAYPPPYPYPAPASAVQPPAYAPEQGYGQPAPQRQTEQAASGNPWAVAPLFRASEMQTERQYREVPNQGYYPAAPQRMTGKYRPLDSDSRASAPPSPAYPPSTPAAGLPYAGGYTSYAYGGWPGQGYGYGGGWPGYGYGGPGWPGYGGWPGGGYGAGFPGGGFPFVGW